MIRRLPQTGQTIHNIFDLGGNRIAEYLYDPATQSSTLMREYVWNEGRAVAVIEGGAIYFTRRSPIRFLM